MSDSDPPAEVSSDEEPALQQPEGDEDSDNENAPAPQPAQNLPMMGAQAAHNLPAMGPQALLQFFAQFQHSRQRAASSHDELVDRLCQAGALTKEDIKAAFASVDRKEYCLGAEDDEQCYSDRPFRAEPTKGCIVHLSAPSIYTRALEALELHPGVSFLNVGSGTGCVSTVVNQLIGRHAVHHGIEIRAPLVELATRLAQQRGGMEGVHFHCGSIHDIDASASIRFDRIYVGAGVRLGDKAQILGLLKVGGIAVGPFEDEDDGEQRLIKVRAALPSP